MIRTKDNAQEMVEVTLMDRFPGKRLSETRVITAEYLQSLKGSGVFDILNERSLGKMWPESVLRVECLGSTNRGWKSYCEATYRVVSSAELAAADFDLLRLQGCFMAGQQCGEVYGHEFDKETGLWHYTCKSVSDWSD